MSKAPAPLEPWEDRNLISDQGISKRPIQLGSLDGQLRHSPVVVLTGREQALVADFGQFCFQDFGFLDAIALSHRLTVLQDCAAGTLGRKSGPSLKG
jgi:hypothetical protein